MNRFAALPASILTLALLAACAESPGQPIDEATYREPHQAVELCVNADTGEALPENQQHICEDDYHGPYPSGFDSGDFLLGYIIASALSPVPYGQPVDYSRRPPQGLNPVDHRRHQSGIKVAQQKRDAWIKNQNAKPAPAVRAPAPDNKPPAQGAKPPAPAVRAPAPAVRAPAPAPAPRAPAPAPRAR